MLSLKDSKRENYTFESNFDKHINSDMTVEIWKHCRCGLFELQPLIWGSYFALHINLEIWKFHIFWISSLITVICSSKKWHIGSVHPPLNGTYFFRPFNVISFNLCVLVERCQISLLKIFLKGFLRAEEFVGPI